MEKQLVKTLMLSALMVTSVVKAECDWLSEMSKSISDTTAQAVKPITDSQAVQTVTNSQAFTTVAQAASIACKTTSEYAQKAFDAAKATDSYKWTADQLHLLHNNGVSKLGSVQKSVVDSQVVKTITETASATNRAASEYYKKAVDTVTGSDAYKWTEKQLPVWYNASANELNKLSTLAQKNPEATAVVAVTAAAVAGYYGYKRYAAKSKTAR